MSKLELAKCVCKLAHKGQKDKGGNDYYLHPYTVADMCKTRDEKIVAYLHDIIEDTDVTFDDLKKLGFSRRIRKALQVITRDPIQTYERYISNIPSNRLAAKVKIADLIHNSDISRIANPTQEDIDRCETYKTYIGYINAQINKISKKKTKKKD